MAGSDGGPPVSWEWSCRPAGVYSKPAVSKAWRGAERDSVRAAWKTPAGGW